jgi:uncharacterized protein involved in exopolysaccharide biosynthesis
MSESEHEAPYSGLNLSDIPFILWRHKWKVILCAAAGIVAAAAAYTLLPIYESQAKLLVRYVVDRSTIDKLDSAAEKPSSQSENIINSEVEILTSTDLAAQVADAVGVERLLQGSKRGATKADAAASIVRALQVTALKGTNIIVVSYANKDPELAVRVLQELISRYFDMHLEVHRSVGAFELVTRETDRLRSQLNQTEEELKQLKARVGINSLGEGATTINAELAKGQQDLDAVEEELAAQQALVKEMEKWLAGSATNQSRNAGHEASSEAVGQYKNLGERVAYLRQLETELLSKYTPENRIVKAKQAQIEALEKQRRDLEQGFPSLPGTASSEDGRSGLVTERTRLVAIEAKTEMLRARLNGIKERAKMLSELAPRIAQLERIKEVEETNYKYFDASLEKARVDETLDPTRMPNISVVQKPSAAGKSTKPVMKIVFGLAAGGLGVGIALALLIELVLDRTVKRRLELETRLRIPLLLSIPYFGRNGHLHLQVADKDSGTGLQESPRLDIAQSENGHGIRPFCEAIRDRLILYFEQSRMTHRPKLVAVTSCSGGAGASTLAAGLADSLSGASDGKVLLVDKVCDPKQFYRLIGDFKASDFDYVIFDIPSVSDTSATLAMASVMDKVLLVVEAEVSSREVVKRAYAELVAANANVSAVFNKSRSYGPKWLEGEL